MADTHGTRLREGYGAATAPMIEMKGVAFSYAGGAFSLRVDELLIGAGEHTAFIGPSGCGKTTLINLMAGILIPQAGEIRIAGEEVSSLGDASRRALRIRRIGMMFQEFELLEYLTGMENILLPFLVGGMRLTADARARATELAGACGIAHGLDRKPRRLSQGERQRVALCRALATEPEIVICDEPTGNLDPDSSEAAVDVLLEQVTARGATLIVVTHNYGVLDRFDRVVDMRSLLARRAP